MQDIGKKEDRLVFIDECCRYISVHKDTYLYQHETLSDTQKSLKKTGAKKMSADAQRRFSWIIVNSWLAASRQSLSA